jgi:hypothetical protein
LNVITGRMQDGRLRQKKRWTIGPIMSSIKPRNLYIRLSNKETA